VFIGAPSNKAQANSIDYITALQAPPKVAHLQGDGYETPRSL